MEAGLDVNSWKFGETLAEIVYLRGSAANGLVGKCGALGRCEAPTGAGLVSEWPERGYCRGSPQGMNAARGLVGVKKVVVT